MPGPLWEGQLMCTLSQACADETSNISDVILPYDPHHEGSVLPNKEYLPSSTANPACYAMLAARV